MRQARRRRHRRRRRRRERALPPPLVDDAVGEILLRLPPDDPACLVRAAAVCRAWRRVILAADPASFSDRYRAFHRTPPVLGFLRGLGRRDLPLFSPTASFRPSATPDHRDRDLLDCRHGRVLLSIHSSPNILTVWDPITGDERRLPEVPGIRSVFRSYAAVLCAGGGCDHRNCHGGPFLVAFLAVGYARDAHAWLYSSATGSWSEQSSTQLEPADTGGSCIAAGLIPAALVGDAVYFIGEYSDRILRYDLIGRGLSTIDPPDLADDYDDCIVMPAGDGLLGLAVTSSYRLCLYRRETDPDDGEDDYGWAISGAAIDLKMLLPDNDHVRPPSLIGFADGPDVIFLNRCDGLFTIDLKSLRTRKLCERDDSCEFLYSCFYTPDCAI